MITVADPDQPRWSSPSPSLILPIVHQPPSQAVPPASASVPVPPAGSETSHAPQRDSHARPSARSARSDTLALLGFGLAWIATTGSGAVLVGRWMTSSRPAAPTPAIVADVARRPPSPPRLMPCPAPEWEPPLVSVKDLPPARWAPGRVMREAPPHVADATSPAPPPAPARVMPQAPAVHAQEPAPVAAVAPPAPRALPSDHHADAASWGPHNQRAAKSGPPRSLEDWIRGAVTSQSAGSN
ncbi:MAG: hypothetical protein FWD17_05755 [Polyangiaceae bacterium]|nr:hypothetical protein [Polyangiaceae bacterium]